MQLDKLDLLTIAVLMVVFFSMATWNLGLTHTPITAVQFFEGQSFYIDMGAQTAVKSAVLLLKHGSFNITVSTGSPGNWSVKPNTVSFSDYYKWYEVSVQQSTQYLKFDFNESSNAIIGEMAVINLYGEKIQITSVNNLGSENPNLSALIDEQEMVQYPATYMSQTYFDEIYFVRTAEEYLNHQWPYEWTHPPLGKLIQASGIAIFGFNPFGWRIMGVIFATLMIPIMFLLAKRLFGTWIGAFASAFLLTFDFMHFTMGRMGTADTYVVFFSLLSQLFFLFYFLNVVKNGWKTSVLPLFLAVVFFALGFSTKWLVLYGAVGMLFLIAALRIKDLVKTKGSIADKYAAFFDHPFLLLFGFIGIAVGIYFLTYIPDMLIGRPFYGFNGVIQLQFDMYGYHSTLVATHDFASSWWSWPLMVSFRGYVPLWLAISNLPNNIHSTIAVFGNPAVWWVGFASIIAITLSEVGGKIVAIIKRTSYTLNLTAVFIIALFFFSWIPYVLISRLTFIYHFYVAMPYLCLGSAYLINKYWNTFWGRAATIALFEIVVILFLVFYPVTSGAPTPINLTDKLKWFSSWYF
jgi:dolichyl-phosphate-mannose-protein mannosyltransferase